MIFLVYLFEKIIITSRKIITIKQKENEFVCKFRYIELKISLNLY
jgi:hypothetical protein